MPLESKGIIETFSGVKNCVKSNFAGKCLCSSDIGNSFVQKM